MLCRLDYPKKHQVCSRTVQHLHHLHVWKMAAFAWVVENGKPRRKTQMPLKTSWWKKPKMDAVVSVKGGFSFSYGRIFRFQCEVLGCMWLMLLLRELIHLLFMSKSESFCHCDESFQVKSVGKVARCFFPPWNQEFAPADGWKTHLMICRTTFTSFLGFGQFSGATRWAPTSFSMGLWGPWK